MNKLSNRAVQKKIMLRKTTVLHALSLSQPLKYAIVQRDPCKKGQIETFGKTKFS